MTLKLIVNKNSSKPACSHRNLVFLGKQQIDCMNNFVYLYNCLSCHSTIIGPNIDQVLKSKK